MQNFIYCEKYHGVYQSGKNHKVTWKKENNFSICSTYNYKSKQISRKCLGVILYYNLTKNTLERKNIFSICLSFHHISKVWLRIEIKYVCVDVDRNCGMSICDFNIKVIMNVEYEVVYLIYYIYRGFAYFHIEYLSFADYIFLLLSELLINQSPL